MKNRRVVPVGNPDRFLASTIWEKRMCRAGVPHAFWNTELRQVKLRTTNFFDKKISATAQRQWIRSFIKNPSRKRPLIAISSAPTDNGARYLAYLFMKQAAKAGENTAILDASQPVPMFDKYPRLIIIHNLLKTASNERKERIRDILIRFEFAFRIVTIAGEDDPFSWVTGGLGKYPDMVFKTADMEVTG